MFGRLMVGGFGRTSSGNFGIMTGGRVKTGGVKTGMLMLTGGKC